MAACSFVSLVVCLQLFSLAVCRSVETSTLEGVEPEPCTLVGGVVTGVCKSRRECRNLFTVEAYNSTSPLCSSFLESREVCCVDPEGWKSLNISRDVFEQVLLYATIIDATSEIESILSEVQKNHEKNLSEMELKAKGKPEDKVKESGPENVNNKAFNVEEKVKEKAEEKVKENVNEKGVETTDVKVEQVN